MKIAQVDADSIYNYFSFMNFGYRVIFEITTIFERLGVQNSYVSVNSCKIEVAYFRGMSPHIKPLQKPKLCYNSAYIKISLNEKPAPFKIRGESQKSV